MPKFSQESFSKLTTCHQDLQALCYEIIKYVDCTVLQGYRNEEDQEKAFAQGSSKLHFPHSFHNLQPAMAVDLTPDPIDYSAGKHLIWFGGFVQGIAIKLKEEGKMTHSIRWGGAWNGLGNLNNGHELCDLVHFELVT